MFPKKLLQASGDAFGGLSKGAKGLYQNFTEAVQGAFKNSADNVATTSDEITKLNEIYEDTLDERTLNGLRNKLQDALKIGKVKLGIADRFAQGTLTKAQVKNIERYLEQQTGTKIHFKSEDAWRKGNNFDQDKNIIFLRESRKNQPQGAFLEEVQHALDQHEEYVKQGLDYTSDRYFGTKRGNDILHSYTFDNIANNPKFKNILNKSERQAFRN